MYHFLQPTYLYNLLSCTATLLGTAQHIALFLVFSSVVNVALDTFTILVLDMGVAGAGWATITAQAISGILCLVYMRRKFTILKMDEEEWKPDRHYMKILYMEYHGTPVFHHGNGKRDLQTSVNSLGP